MTLDDDLDLSHQQFLEKEEALDLMLAANESRVKTLDRLMKREEYYLDLKDKYKDLQEAYQELLRERGQL